MPDDDTDLVSLATSPYFVTGQPGVGRGVYRVTLYRAKRSGYHVCLDYKDGSLGNCRHFHDYKAAVARWAGEVMMLAAGSVAVEGQYAGDL